MSTAPRVTGLLTCCLLLVPACNESAVPPEVRRRVLETEDLVVEMAAPRLEGAGVHIGPIRARMRDMEHMRIWSLRLSVIADRDGDGQADAGEELWTRLRTYPGGACSFMRSCLAELAGEPGSEGLALAWELSFGEGGSATGWEPIVRR